jgi:endonuclease YncB( thermonuclease family)
MHHDTPFFQGFSSILFGRPALSGLQQKLRDVAALNTLSDFFATFGFLIPDALLRRRSTGMNSRQRRFTLHVTFWAFLAQTLAPETSCRDIVRKVQAWWLIRAPKSAVGSSSTAAYTKARQRLDPDSIQDVGRHLVERLEGRVQPSQLWLGRRVRVVDGTTVSMPDTPENQEKYPQPSSQKAGCGFPQMRVVGLFSLASGALLDFARSSIHVHESILFRQLVSTLQKSDIALADRGFCSFHSFWNLSQAGIDALMRLSGARKVDFRKGVRLGPNARLITWKKPAQCPKGCTREEYDALPASMTLRHLKLTVSARRKGQ